MASTIQGRCLCGHVRYEYSGRVGPANYCHCEDCRRCTGSAFNIGVGVPADSLRVSGKVQSYPPDDGREAKTTREFCPTCGSRVPRADSRSSPTVATS